MNIIRIPLPKKREADPFAPLLQFDEDDRGLIEVQVSGELVWQNDTFNPVMLYAIEFDMNTHELVLTLENAKWTSR